MGKKKRGQGREKRREGGNPSKIWKIERLLFPLSFDMRFYYEEVLQRRERDGRPCENKGECFEGVGEGEGIFLDREE